MSEITRLYGFDGDEHLQADPSEVLQQWLDDHDFDGEASDPLGGLPPLIEEWDVYPPRHHMPGTGELLEWIAEWAGERGDLMEDAGEWFSNACGSSEVAVLADALLYGIAASVRGRMARTKLRALVVTRADDGEWLIDGERAWVLA